MPWEKSRSIKDQQICFYLWLHSKDLWDQFAKESIAIWDFNLRHWSHSKSLQKLISRVYLKILSFVPCMRIESLSWKKIWTLLGDWEENSQSKIEIWVPLILIFSTYHIKTIFSESNESKSSKQYVFFEVELTLIYEARI